MQTETEARGLSVNECQASRYLYAAGYSTPLIGGFLEAPAVTVARHVRGDCECPDDAEPLPPDVVTGDDLVSRRRELGLTQGDLAERLGVSRTSVSQWERGKMSPRRDRARAITRALEEAGR